MPTWDTRYLMTPDLKKFSEVFYNVIYAYREERDLSAEELQMKLNHRDKVVAEERLAMLEEEHGLEGAQIILRMEARIAQGLPAESPPLPVVPTSPSDLKEVSLYAGRKEKVVADDAISVLEMEIDQDNDDNANSNTSTIHDFTTDISADGQRTQDGRTGSEDGTGEEEDVEKVMADLRRSVSIATLGYWSDNNSRSTSSLSATATLSAASSTSTISLPQQHSYTRYANITYTTLVKTSATTAATAQRPRLAHTKSLARFGSIAQNQFPVSPGDIFGISRHAIEQRELQEFLSVARTSKRRKAFGNKNSGITSGKRISQWRLQNKRLRPLSPSRPAFGAAAHHLVGSTPLFVLRRAPRQHNVALLQAANSSSSNSRSHAVPTAPLPSTSSSPAIVSVTKSRRGRTRQFRKELEVYLSQGLTKEEAVQQRQQDKRRRKRAAKRAKLAAALERERLERERLLAREAQAAADRERAREQEKIKAVTMEETEVLEAFDYLTDAEFEEFMVLAGLTLVDVERIREKAAVAALEQVTEDIRATGRVQAATAANTKKREVEVMVVVEDEEATVVNTVAAQESIQTENITVTSNIKKTPVEPESSETREFKPEEATTLAVPMDHQRRRPISPQHMTSMELLIKNTAVIGDSNLRCYPIIPTTSTSSASAIAASAAISAAAASAGHGLLSQASTVMATLPTHATKGEDEVIEITSRDMTGVSRNRSSISLLITKGVPHLENHHSSSSSLATFSNSSTSSSSSLASAVSDDEEDSYEDSNDDSFEDSTEEDDDESTTTTSAMTSTTTVTTTTSGNVQIFEFETVVEESDYPVFNKVAYDSDGEELEILDVNQNTATNMVEDEDDEEAAELRELLKSMTPEERCEFLRLSRQEESDMINTSATIVVA